MPDTQFPRFYVFEQPAENRPFIHAGSVHAPDAEMALLTARDVFGRRPQRNTMWVVRDNDIFARTIEELEGIEVAEPGSCSGGETYQVFVKRTHKGVFVHAGEIEASDAEEAFTCALEHLDVSKGLVWWIIRNDAIKRAQPDDTEAMYDSSRGKEYRHESHYHVRTMMMDLKKKKQKD